MTKEIIILEISQFTGETHLLTVSEKDGLLFQLAKNKTSSKPFGYQDKSLGLNCLARKILN